MLTFPTYKLWAVDTLRLCEDSQLWGVLQVAFANSTMRGHPTEYTIGTRCQLGTKEGSEHWGVSAVVRRGSSMAGSMAGCAMGFQWLVQNFAMGCCATTKPKNHNCLWYLSIYSEVLVIFMILVMCSMYDMYGIVRR